MSIICRVCTAVALDIPRKGSFIGRVSWVCPYICMPWRKQSETVSRSVRRSCRLCLITPPLTVLCERRLLSAPRRRSQAATYALSLLSLISGALRRAASPSCLSGLRRSGTTLENAMHPAAVNCICLRLSCAVAAASAITSTTAGSSAAFHPCGEAVGEGASETSKDRLLLDDGLV